MLKIMKAVVERHGAFVPSLDDIVSRNENTHRQRRDVLPEQLKSLPFPRPISKETHTSKLNNIAIDVD